MVADPLCLGNLYPAEAVNTAGETHATSYNWWTSSPNLYVDPFANSEITSVAGYANGSYYLYATATNACGTSATQSVGIDVVICMSGLTYEVFPNPARDKLFINFGNENPGVAQTLSYRLYHESSTNPVRSIDAGEGLMSENNRLMIPVDNLPRGTYYLHLATPDGKTDKVRVKLE